MRKIIGILIFTATLLFGLSAFCIFQSLNSPDIQDSHYSLVDVSAPEQRQPLNDTESVSLIPESLSLAPCKDEDSSKYTLNYKSKAVSTGIINQRALCGDLPEHPLQLRDEKTSGLVMVYIQVNEIGEVAEANSKTGHHLIRPLAEKAAYKTKFSPFKYKGKTYRMFGVLIYHFDFKDGASLINPTTPKSLSLLNIRQGQ